MAKKQKRRGRRVPQRTCVGCRSVTDKRALIRVVRTPDGVLVDESGKKAGRGAYLHDRLSCWDRGLKGSLANALRTDLREEDLNRLRSYMEALPDDEN